MPSQWKISVRLDLVVIGQDSEMSDMSNPNGNIHAEEAYLLATHTNGRQYAGVSLGLMRDTTQEQLEVKSAQVQASLPEDFDPSDAVKFPNWTETYPVYGSDAYLSTSEEQAHADNHSETGSARFVGYH